MDVIIEFDRFCSVCRALASVMEEQLPQGWRLEPSSARLNEIQIRKEGQLIAGTEAWDFLVRHAPQLRVYQRMATRIGLAPPRQAQFLRFLGHSLRRLCYSCPK